MHGGDAEKSVAFVISAFNPSPVVNSLIAEASRQASIVIVVDDTGELRSGENRLQAGAMAGNVVIIEHARNLGIAAALNRGIREALGVGADYVLTFDQDTTLSVGFVEHALEALRRRQALSPTLMGAAPRTVNGLPYAALHAHGDDRCSLEVIQSGLLLDSSIFMTIGFFREDFFIDGVEADFFLRMHAAGLHCMLIGDMDLAHELGSPRPITVFGRSITTNNHSSLRRYFITRNRLVLLRESGRAEPQWARVVRRRLLRQSILALFEAEGARKGRLMVLGAVHSAIGRSGPHGRRPRPTVRRDSGSPNV